MADRQHPYRHRVQFTIEILHVPLHYPIKELEYDVMQRWGYCIDGCRVIGNESDHRGTRIFYINFSNESEMEATECAEFLKEQGYIIDGMWMKKKIREVETRGRERGRGRGRGHVTSPEQPNPGYTLPRNMPFPKMATKEFIVHVKNIPSFIDEDIFKDMILGADYKVKIREDHSNELLKEALVYVPDEFTMKDLISKLSRVTVGGNTLDAKEKGRSNPAQNNVNPSDDMQQPRPDAKQVISYPQQGNNKQHTQVEPEPRM